MRFNPLPPSISTFARRQSSTMGLRTNAAGALAVRNLGSSLALKVMAVSLHGFIVATWWTSVRLRSALFRIFFDAKVSEIVRTELKFSGWFPSTSGIRRSSPILATCRSIQHALRLWVGVASSALRILQGPSSHFSSTVPCPLEGFDFLAFNQGALLRCALLIRTGLLFMAGLSQYSISVFRALSMAQYFCTMDARTAKRVILRRLMVLSIPLSVQLLQKIEIASPSRQYFILFITRRNLAQ